MSLYIHRKLNGDLTHLWDVQQSVQWEKWFKIGDPPFPLPLKARDDCIMGKGEYPVHDMNGNRYKINITCDIDRFSIKIHDRLGNLCYAPESKSYVRMQNMQDESEAFKVHEAAQSSFVAREVWHV